jgi:hypothetical protein
MAQVEEIRYTVTADTSDVEEKLTKVGDSAAATGAAAGGLTKQLDSLTGGLASGFVAGASSLKRFGGGMKGLNAVLKASPIFLLVGLLASVVTAFRSSEQGAEKFNRIMGVLGSVMDNILDVVADVGEKLISIFSDPQQALKDFANLITQNITNRFEGLAELIPELVKALQLLFSGEFSEAGKTAANAVGKVALGVEDVVEKTQDAIDASKDFVEQVVEEGKQADIIAQKRNKATRLERKLLVDRSKLESEIAGLRLKSRQEDEFSAEVRKAALLEAQRLEEDLLARETEVLVLRRDAQVEENKLARSTQDALDKEAQAIAAVNQQQANRLNQQRSTQRELNRLNKEIERDRVAARKAADKELKDMEKAQAELLAALETDAQQKEIDKLVKHHEGLFAKSMALRDKELALIEQEVMDEDEKRRRIAEVNARYDEQERMLMEAQGVAVQRINKKYADQEAKVVADARKAVEDAEKQKAQARKQNLDQSMAMVNAAFGFFQALTAADADASEEEQERAFKRNKAAQIAQTIAGTAAAVVAAINPAVGGLGIPAGLPGAATAALTGATQLATIKQTQFSPSGGASEPSMPEPPSLSSTASQVTQGTGAPQIDLSFLGDSITQDIRAYVLTEEVNTAQQITQKIDDQANVT